MLTLTQMLALLVSARAAAVVGGEESPTALKEEIAELRATVRELKESYGELKAAFGLMAKGNVQHERGLQMAGSCLDWCNPWTGFMPACSGCSGGNKPQPVPQPIIPPSPFDHCPHLFWAGQYHFENDGGMQFNQDCIKDNENCKIVPKDPYAEGTRSRIIECGIGNPPGYPETAYIKRKTSGAPDAKADLCWVSPWSKVSMECVEHDEITYSEFRALSVNADCSVEKAVWVSYESWGNSPGTASWSTQVYQTMWTRKATSPKKICEEPPVLY
jgi:hypothetical protein